MSGAALLGQCPKTQVISKDISNKELTTTTSIKLRKTEPNKQGMTPLTSPNNNTNSTGSGEAGRVGKLGKEATKKTQLIQPTGTVNNTRDENTPNG